MSTQCPAKGLNDKLVWSLSPMAKEAYECLLAQGIESDLAFELLPLIFDEVDLFVLEA